MTAKKINLTQLNNWKKKDVPGDYWPVDFMTSQLQTATFCVDYDGEVHRHKHKHEDNFWYIVSGAGWVKLDDEEIPVEAGDALMIPRNTFHSARTDEKSRMRILQVECIEVTPPRKKSSSLIRESNTPQPLPKKKRDTFSQTSLKIPQLGSLNPGKISAPAPGTGIA